MDKQAHVLRERKTWDVTKLGATLLTLVTPVGRGSTSALQQGSSSLPPASRRQLKKRKISANRKNGTVGAKAKMTVTRQRERINNINIRLTHDEYEALVGKVKISGLTISEFVRRVINGRKVVSRADQNTINELRRQGGLLKLIHVESGGTYSEKTAAAIDDLRTVIRTLTIDIHQNHQSQ